jgi:hypothetical protein
MNLGQNYKKIKISQFSRNDLLFKVLNKTEVNYTAPYVKTIRRNIFYSENNFRRSR